MDVSLSKLQDMMKDRKSGVLQSIRLQGVRHNRWTKQQQLIKLVEEDREVTRSS